jgi:DNA-binding MarR family transcriptional regulator
MTDTFTHIAPMPSTVARTLTAQAKIASTVVQVLARHDIRATPAAGLLLAFIGEQSMPLRDAIRLGYVRNSNFQGVMKRLHDAGLLTFYDLSVRKKRLGMKLTPRGLQIADAIRRALGGDGE